ncbi:hypothetical protein [Chryseobacterium sp. HMWF035]|uniref:hypothetical protein n=2 Tax=unclassified Chryseobacterium TaxID=2593645 RepID=UPI000F4E3CAF|nr:hypothetical protein [Chryseobacterium sp. HMWF035]
MGSAGLSLYMDTLLKPCLFLLFSKGGCGLRDLQEMMDDTANEKRIALGKQSPYPVYRSFFENFSHKRYEATKMALYTRIQNLSNHWAVYHMLNGVPTVNFERAIDQGMVVLVNLSK